jgi:hypothetical protein
VDSGLKRIAGSLARQVHRWRQLIVQKAEFHYQLHCVAMELHPKAMKGTTVPVSGFNRVQLCPLLCT